MQFRIFDLCLWTLRTSSSCGLNWLCSSLMIVIIIVFLSRTVPKSTWTWHHSTYVISFLVKVLLLSPILVLWFSQEESLFSCGRGLAVSAGLLLGEAGHGSSLSDGEQGSVSPWHRWLEEN